MIELDHDEKLKMCDRMNRFGGSFTKAIAECFILADNLNLKRLYAAFPELVETYGPNGPFAKR